MKYRPGLPSHNSNVAHEHPLKEFFVLTAGAVLLLVVAVWLLGFMVDRAVNYIDPETEYALFSELGSDSPAQPTEQEAELQKLVDSLAPCVGITHPISLRIRQSGELNAFAEPGGKVVVLSGLIDKLESENGLAFVLAHELGHFQNRDHLRGMGRAVVLLAASVLVTGANSDISSTLAPVVQARMASYSQSRENAADETALHALQCHYGHVGGAAEFFDLVKAEEESADFNWGMLHYFGSHPEVEARIEALRVLSKTFAYEARPPLRDPSRPG